MLAAAPPDTVIARVVPLEPEWFVRLADVLRVVLTCGALVLLVAAALAAWKFRKTSVMVRHLLDRVSADVAPLAQRTRRIADNVDAVSGAVRSDLERMSALVTRTEQRIDDTLARAEARTRDLEALLDVAQREAAHSLVAAAATAAGVREGFAALRDELVGRAARADADAGSAVDGRTNARADAHADARASADDADGGPARPRIRRHADSPARH